MLERHPLSAAFPSMPAIEQDELTEDIERNGLIEPIMLYQGMVLDGWHRYQSCCMLEIEPAFTEYAGSDPVAYVISRNIHRRSLTGSQRAAAIVACSNWAKSGRPEKGEVTSSFSTKDSMAKAAGVSAKTIQQAKAAHSAGLGDAVKNGKLTVEQAAAIAKLPENQRPAAIENPKSVTKPVPPPAVEPDPVPEFEDEMISVSRSDYEEMLATLEELNQAQRDMEAVLMADDKIAAASVKIIQLESLNSALQARLNGELNKNAELIKIVKGKDKIIAKLEKELEAFKLEALPV